MTMKLYQKGYDVSNKNLLLAEREYKLETACGEGSCASDIVLTRSTCPRGTEGYARKMTTTG